MHMDTIIIDTAGWVRADAEAESVEVQMAYDVTDPLAVRILGVPPDAEEAPGRRAMRLFIAARTRFAELLERAAAGDFTSTTAPVPDARLRNLYAEYQLLVATS